MGKKISSETHYSSWFKDNWIKTGGLITPAIASKILGTSMARINQIWKEKDFEKFIYDDEKKPLLSISDVMTIQDEMDSVKEKNTVAIYEDMENGYTIKLDRHGSAIDDIRLDEAELGKTIKAVLNCAASIQENIKFIEAYEVHTKKELPKSKKTITDRPIEL